MKMPNNANAVVEAKKIIGYLLSESHPQGKSKADFFRSFGFDATAANILEQALRMHALDRDVIKSETTDFGQKYRLACGIQTPDQRNPCIVSVWIIEKATDAPRLITAYPAK